MNAITRDFNADQEFDLDIRIVESAPVVAELMQDTSDNCGSTNQSACVTCVVG